MAMQSSCHTRHHEGEVSILTLFGSMFTDRCNYRVPLDAAPIDVSHGKEENVK